MLAEACGLSNGLMVLARRWKLTIPGLILGMLSLSLWPAHYGVAAPGTVSAVNRSEPPLTSASRQRPAPSSSGQGVSTSGKTDPASLPEAMPERATVQSVQAEIDELARWVGRKKGQISATVLELDTGKILAGLSERRVLNPASNQKLITAATALDLLGAGYRYTTGVYGHIDDGRADRLVLRGHGDPSLTTADLWDMAFTLSEMGLEHVGAVEVDGSRFDGSFVPPAFDQQPNEWSSFRAPISAVALERNSVTLNVLAGEAGQSARVWVDPPGFVELQGSIETKAAGVGQAVRLTLSPSGSSLVAKIGGHVPAGSGRLRFTRRVDDPTLFAGYVFRHCLQKLGISVAAGVRRGSGKEKNRLVFTASSPLRDLLDELGKDSDNFFAEMIFKSLGAELVEEPARSSDGAKVVIEWLKALNAYPRGSRIMNGSGLFDANLISSLTLVQVLQAAYGNPAIRPEFLSQLAIGGTDGTLRSRFKARATKGRIRAKTGTLARVDALSGYVLSPQGRSVVAFSLIVNGVAEHWDSRARMDRVATALAEHVWR